jgi:hypothetical protein
MTKDEKIQEQIKDFVELMTKLKMHEVPGEHDDNPQEKCKICHHPVCFMVQKCNKPLLCYLNYIKGENGDICR